MPNDKPFITKEDAIIKIRTFCNYRDRCHMEVVDKLYDLGLHKKDVEFVTIQMIEEDLLNEERYARSYVRGYFRMKSWGKQRIVYELKRRRIHDKLIQIALTEIDDDDYETTFKHLIDKQLSKVSGPTFQRSQKIARYMNQKGYSYGDFGTYLKQVLSSSR